MIEVNRRAFNKPTLLKCACGFITSLAYALRYFPNKDEYGIDLTCPRCKKHEMEIVRE